MTAVAGHVRAGAVVAEAGWAAMVAAAFVVMVAAMVAMCRQPAMMAARRGKSVDS